MADADKPRRAIRRDPAFIEQYKVYVQSADNTSERRVNINRYQVGLNIGVIVLYGLDGIIPNTNLQPAIWIIVALAGITISLNWLFTIQSLRRLNVEKFKIIHSMEAELPRAIYTEEWHGLGRGSGEKKGWEYQGANFFENQIPVVFIALHSTAICYTVFQWIH